MRPGTHDRATPPQPAPDGRKPTADGSPPPTQRALWKPIEPVPPEAHDAHPLAQGRVLQDAMDEEAWDWSRTPTDAEFAHDVGIDINLAFIAAACSPATVCQRTLLYPCARTLAVLLGGQLISLSGVTIGPRFGLTAQPVWVGLVGWPGCARPR